MAQQVAITLNTVPYNPNGTISPGVISWEDRSSGVVEGFSRLTQKYTSIGKGRKYTKGEVRLVLPVIATASDTCVGVCSGEKLYENGMSVSFWRSAASTAADATDLLTRFRDFVNSTQFADMVVNYDPAYV